MTRDQAINISRKAILGKVQEYWSTCKEGKPGCKEKLKKAVNAFNETKAQFESWGRKMPSANQIGYADIRDTLNEHARHYGLM